MSMSYSNAGGKNNKTLCTFVNMTAYKLRPT